VAEERDASLNKLEAAETRLKGELDEVTALQV